MPLRLALLLLVFGACTPATGIGAPAAECVLGEVGCEVSCGLDQYTCNDRKCIARSLVCNGPSDCAANEDEQNCVVRTGCPEGQHFCDNRCLPNTLVCDARIDCGDLTDELACAAELSLLGTDCPRDAPFACPQGTIYACAEEDLTAACNDNGDGDDACPNDEPFACPQDGNGSCTDDPTGRSNCGNRQRETYDPFTGFYRCPGSTPYYCGGGWCASRSYYC